VGRFRGGRGRSDRRRRPSGIYVRRGVGFFEADAGAGGSAELDGDVDERLKGDGGGIEEDLAEVVQGSGLSFWTTRLFAATEEISVFQEISEL
jgi:hypothetical protein